MTTQHRKLHPLLRIDDELAHRRRRFAIKWNDTAGWAEHDWLGLKDGEVVTGFAGSNAAERWLADRLAEVK